MKSAGGSELSSWDSSETPPTVDRDESQTDCVLLMFSLDSKLLDVPSNLSQASDVFWTSESKRANYPRTLFDGSFGWFGRIAKGP